MPHNENSRVKIPALVHFTRLGYKYISLRKYEGVIDDDTNILVDVLCDAINRINATSLTTTDVQKIVNTLKAMLENDDLGRKFYSVLINGYNGLKLIDFEDFGGTVNSYHVVTEMTCKNGSDEFRPDITPLINGLPLAFIEVKKPNNKGGIKAEYDRMLMRVKNKKFRRFINLTQIMVFSNNSEYDDTEAVPLEGAFYSTISYEKLFFSHFREEDEKLLTSVPEKDEAVENFILTDNNLSSIKYSPEYVTNSSPVSPTNRIITSLFSFERILTFLKYAIAYVERTDENGITHLEKHLMRYPQFFATKAIENIWCLTPFCYSFSRDPFRLAQCWRSSLSASLRKESWNMTAITNALSTAATGSSQGYAVQSCSPQQASGTPTSSINSKIMMTTSGLP